MKKKALKITAIIVVLIVGTLFAAPYLFKDTLADLIKNKVNNSIEAKFDFETADLSLFAGFPNAKVTLTAITIINEAPFEGDTLFAADRVFLELPVSQLFKGASDPIAIKDFILERPFLRIEVDRLGRANYDITKTDTGTESTAESTENNFVFSLPSYTIEDAVIAYADKSSGIELMLTDVQHTGNGDLSLTTSQLATKTTALVSFAIDSTNYLNRNKLQLDALIGIDLATNTYSFLENSAVINQLPLVFDGYVQLFDAYTDVAIHFETPSTDFKNFLAVIPEAYSQNIEEVTTTGNFMVDGKFMGKVDDLHIPKFLIQVNSENASFKYPDLPKTVKDVVISTVIANDTGKAADTYIDIENLTFSIDEDTFAIAANITDILDNTKVVTAVKGRMNLGNIAKAYPMPADLDLKGMLTADINAAFDMASLEQKQYERTQANGNFNLKGFEYVSDELSAPLQIRETALTFNPKTVSLTSFDGTLGASDFKASGTVDNLLGFVFNHEDIKGDFIVDSDTFSVNDFMVADTSSEKDEVTTKQPETEEVSAIKIPAFLDCNIKVSAATVIYDDLKLQNVKGDLTIKDEKATLTNMTSSIFDGELAFGGEVSTKSTVPEFAMKLGMNNFKIGETFKALDLFKVLAPIANALEGRLNSDIEISGNLTKDFIPDLASISGDVFTKLLTAKVNPNQSQLLSTLDTNLSFVDFSAIDAQDLEALLSFVDGKVNVKPVNLNYKDIAIAIEGNHTFDKKMNYGITFDVPVKYLGTSVNDLIAKIDDKELEKLTIPVTANVSGDYTSPAVSTDLTSAISDLTTKLVDLQKQKLLNQGKDKATDLLGDILNSNKKETDTAAKNKDAVGEVLGNLLGNKKKDSTVSLSDSVAKKDDPVKKAASNILGGLLKKKKKKDSAVQKKDSVN